VGLHCSHLQWLYLVMHHIHAVTLFCSLVMAQGEQPVAIEEGG
jgi:hypothetical protein